PPACCPRAILLVVLHPDPARVEDLRSRLARCVQCQAPGWVIDLHDATWLAGRVPGQDRLHRLHRRHPVAVRRQVGLRESPDLHPSPAALPLGAGELDERDFLEEAPEDLDPVAALAALVPGFEEGPVVMMVWGDFEFARGPVFDGQLDATLPLVRDPDAVVEA